MGIINLDPFDTDTGFSLTGVYIAVAGNGVFIEKFDEDTYSISTAFSLWKDQTARNDDKTPIITRSVNLIITKADLAGSIYDQVYNQIKTIFTNTSDVLNDT